LYPLLNSPVIVTPKFDWLRQTKKKRLQY
jgi:hypothetical protein